MIKISLVKQFPPAQKSPLKKADSYPDMLAAYIDLMYNLSSPH